MSVSLAGVVLFGCSPAYKLPEAPLRASPEAALIARGEYLVHGPAHCTACHSTAARASEVRPNTKPALVGGREWRMGPLGTLRAPNLTSDPATGLQGISDDNLGHMLRTAQRADGTVSPFMRVVAGQLADDDVLAVVSYLRSLPGVAHAVPASSLGPLGHAVFRSAKPRPIGPAVAPPLGATLERGRYLAGGPAACLRCHSDTDEATGEVRLGSEYAGGRAPMRSEHREEKLRYRAPNLTPDPDTGIAGRWTEAQFLARMRAGPLHGGSPMPWGNYANLHEEDMRALWLFLRSLPPVRNDTGPGVVEPN